MFARTGKKRPGTETPAQSPYDAAADLVEDHVAYETLFSPKITARL